MPHYIRFKHNNATLFGTLSGDTISVHTGDMFAVNAPTGETVALADVTVLTPCDPTKVFGLWNNFHATAAKTGLPRPEHPWYFAMTPNTYAATNTVIRKPAACSGKVVFEAELGIVIGKRTRDITPEQADDHILGYTCINDVTAAEFLFAEEKFAHWSRAKCFDGFCVFGPTIATDINPDDLIIRAILEGPDADGVQQTQERQNYPVSDMFYGPREIVSRISHDLTLEPGDIIACGTSVGAGAMKDGWTVTIAIDGVGQLENTFAAAT